MYNISLFTQILRTDLPIVNLIQNQNVISINEVFCDKSAYVDYDTPIFHSYYLVGEKKLILADETVYAVANVFDSNNYICIGETEVESLPNVEFHHVSKFANTDVNKVLLEILNQTKYDEYKL